MQVFISFSSADKKIAEKIYDRLKKSEIDCWICTRDIPPGADYQACIVDAINTAQVVVLVFSSNANLSSEIAKELSLASKKILIPARIEDVVPQGSFQYQLSNRQFVDLFEDFDARLDELCDRIKSVLDNKGAVQTPPVLSKRKSSKQIRRMAVAVSLTGAVALGGYLALPHLNKTSEVASVSGVPITMAVAPALAKAAPEPQTAQPVAPASQPTLKTEIPATDSAPLQMQAAANQPSAPVAQSSGSPSSGSTGNLVSEKVAGITSALGNAGSYQRLNKLKEMKTQLPQALNAAEIVSLLEGIGHQRNDAIAMLSDNMAPAMGGAELKRILGDTASYNRLNSIKSLAAAGRIKGDLTAAEANEILEGTSHQRNDAIAVIAERLAPELDGKDIATVLGDTTSYNRLNSIKSLARAGRIKRGLTSEEAKAVLEGTSHQRNDAIAVIAERLAADLGGKDLSVILGDTSSYNRLNSIKSLSTAGRVKNGLTPEDAKLVLEGTVHQRNDAIAVIAERLAANLNGNDIAVILGDTASYNRLNSIKSLARANKIRKPLAAADTQLILQNIDAQKAEAMKTLEPYTS